jgi:hypothetical protein
VKLWLDIVRQLINWHIKLVNVTEGILVIVASETLIYIYIYISGTAYTAENTS